MNSRRLLQYGVNEKQDRPGFGKHEECSFILARHHITKKFTATTSKYGNWNIQRLDGTGTIWYPQKTIRCSSRQSC